VVVLAAGNAPLLDREGILFRPLIDAKPTQLALAWKRDEITDTVRDYADSAQQVARERIGALPVK
jgi:hypothetical protein